MLEVDRQPPPTVEPRSVPIATLSSTTAAPGSGTSRWASVVEQVSTVAGVVAPTTVVTALLYYFGYVATYARYGYFGVDAATLRLPTQDLVLQSVAVVYVPCAVLFGLGIACVVVRNQTRAALRDEARWLRLRQLGRAAVLLGVVLLLRALLGMVVPDIARTERPATTPSALGAGVLSILYGRHLLRSTGRSRGGVVPERALSLLTAGIVVLSLFWIANSFAAEYGRGQAQVDSEALASRPAVTLDTGERLYLNEACVQEVQLPADTEQAFRYRVRGLRLLAVGRDRLFLVPDRWRDGCDVLVVPDDSSIRVQFGRR